MGTIFKFCERCNKKRKHEFEIKTDYRPTLQYEDDHYSQADLIAFANGDFSDAVSVSERKFFKCLACNCVYSIHYDPEYEVKLIEKELNKVVKNYIQAQDLARMELSLDRIIKKNGYDDEFNLVFLHSAMANKFIEASREDLLEKPAEYIFEKIRRIYE